MVERTAHNGLVAGSSPAGPTNFPDAIFLMIVPDHLEYQQDQR